MLLGAGFVSLILAAFGFSDVGPYAEFSDFVLIDVIALLGFSLLK